METKIASKSSRRHCNDFYELRKTLRHALVIVAGALGYGFMWVSALGAAKPSENAGGDAHLAPSKMTHTDIAWQARICPNAFSGRLVSVARRPGLLLGGADQGAHDGNPHAHLDLRARNPLQKLQEQAWVTESRQSCWSGFSTCTHRSIRRWIAARAVLDWDPVKELVALHGGSVEAFSEGLDKPGSSGEGSQARCQQEKSADR